MGECEHCRGDIVEITMEQDGIELTMVACNKCDSRHWAVDGRVSDLKGVLATLSDPSPFALRLAG